MYGLAKKIYQGAENLRNFVGDDEFLPPKEIKQALATLLYVFRKRTAEIGAEGFLSMRVGDAQNVSALQALLRTTTGEQFRVMFEKYTQNYLNSTINSVMRKYSGSVERNVLERQRHLEIQSESAMEFSRSMAVAAFPDNNRTVSLGLKTTPKKETSESVSVGDFYDKYEALLVKKGTDEFQARKTINLYKDALDDKLVENKRKLRYSKDFTAEEISKLNNVIEAFTTQEFINTSIRPLLREFKSGNKFEYTEQQTKRYRILI